MMSAVEWERRGDGQLYCITASLTLQDFGAIVHYRERPVVLGVWCVRLEINNRHLASGQVDWCAAVRSGSFLWGGVGHRGEEHGRALGCLCCLRWEDRRGERGVFVLQLLMREMELR